MARPGNLKLCTQQSTPRSLTGGWMLQSKAAFLAFFMFHSVQALMMLQQNTLQLSLDLDRLPGTNHAARAEMVGGTRPGPEAAAPCHGVVSQLQADATSVELGAKL